MVSTRRWCALAIGLSLSACGPTPVEVVRQLEVRSPEALRRAARGALSPDYQDPRGGAEALVSELGALYADTPPWEISLSDLKQQPELSARRLRVSATLHARWDGRPSWRAEGPVRVELERLERWRVIGGWLWQLREARALVGQWRRARAAGDAQALRALLHGGYGQRADPARAVERARRAPPAPLLGVHLQLREGGAHLDLFRKGQATLRWTLRPEAGRLRILAGALR